MSDLPETLTMSTLDFLIDAIERSMEDDVMGMPLLYICISPETFTSLLEDLVIPNGPDRPTFGVIMGVEIVVDKGTASPWGVTADGHEVFL